MDPVSRRVIFGCEAPVGPRGDKGHIRKGKSSGSSFLGWLLSSASSTGFPLQSICEESASLKSRRGEMWETSPAIIPSFEKLPRLKQQSVLKLCAARFSLKGIVVRLLKGSVLGPGRGQSSYAQAQPSSESLLKLNRAVSSKGQCAQRRRVRVFPSVGSP